MRRHCRREYLRTAPGSEECLDRLGSPWSANAFGVLPAVVARKLIRLVILTSRLEATRGLFWDGPRNFEPRSDDEDDA
ncbi:hypothetical protein AVEN_14244-1 [Araneus ventricosus]|uniref:Uncharacterized protein n=1 Tax=Araneus ventricosus TaxID=182803 RepID=A0A4Y2GKA3_ARAVE|nr:hypothetical protein AVEN_14244-1 [Araneus ventricosus]